MSLEETVRKALDLKRLKLPSSLPVASIDFESEEDSSGEEALRVYVILRDDTQDESLSGENVLALKRAIRNSLVHDGIRLFPYVYLRTVSERREELAEEAE